MKSDLRSSKSLVWKIASLALLLMTACRTPNFGELYSPSPGVRGLPRPELVYDPVLTNESLQNASPQPFGREVGPPGRLESERSVSSKVEIALQQQLEEVFSGDRVDEIVTVRYRLDSSEHPGWILSRVVSLLTLSAVNLLGVPVGNVGMSIDLLVVVGPKEDLSYRVSGTGSAYQAYWYGYSWQDAEQLAALRATREALAKLDVELDADSERLRERLTMP